MIRTNVINNIKGEKFKKVGMVEALLKKKDDKIEVIHNFTMEDLRSEDAISIELQIHFHRVLNKFVVNHSIDLKTGKFNTDVIRINKITKNKKLCGRKSSLFNAYVGKEFMKDSSQISFVNYFKQRINLVPEVYQTRPYNKKPIMIIDDRDYESEISYDLQYTNRLRFKKDRLFINRLTEFIEIVYDCNIVVYVMYNDSKMVYMVISNREGDIMYGINRVTNSTVIYEDNEPVEIDKVFIRDTSNKDCFISGKFNLDFEEIQINGGYGDIVTLKNTK